MRFSIAFLLLVFQFSALGQAPVLEPDGGGPAIFDHADELSPAERAAIIEKLQESKVQLVKQGKWLAPVAQATALQWVLRKRDGFNDNGYYGISNYIDHNAAVPNLLLDYNCGNRTYDLSNGYNHKGTDIFTWPFSWHKMNYNQVEVIAGAEGMIIYKSDNNFDKNCAFCTTACNWNAVYLRHADGSIAWYGHLKSGSLTTKAVGENVAAGEYLGVVGSSGNSTGPHLHLELYTNDNYNQLIDPWAGACNALNGNNSGWVSQQPYRVSTLNWIGVHGAAPAHTQCPEGELVNEKRSFTDGQKLYLGCYYRDQISGQSATHTIRRPDNTVFSTWVQNLDATFNASWWWYSGDLPNPAPTGVWKYEISYNGQLHTTTFAVNSTLKFEFNGNGSYFTPGNWVNAQMPPNPVPNGVEVLINPAGSGVCEITNVVQLLPGSQLKVMPTKKVLMQHNLLVQ